MTTPPPNNQHRKEKDVKIQTAQFAQALDLAANVVGRRNTIAILGCVKVEPGAINATNLALDLRIGMPEAPDAIAPFALPQPRDFAKLLRAMGDEVSIEHLPSEADDDANRIAITASRSKGTIKCQPVDDFPAAAPRPELSSCELTLEQIDLILRVARAMSTEETRYYLNGVYIHHEADWTYKVVATDGHRLYMATIEIPGMKSKRAIGRHDYGSSAGIIIPRAAINLIRKLRPRMTKGQPVTFSTYGAGPVSNQVKDLAPSSSHAIHSRTSFRFSIGEHTVELTAKLIDGTFPDYTRVIPPLSDDMPQVRVNRADLARAIQAITAGVNEKTKALSLTFDPQGGLILSSRWIDAGFEGSIALDANTRVKQPFEIGYNARYLIDICEASRGEELAITTADKGSPGVIVSPEATAFKTVLMPMRI